MQPTENKQPTEKELIAHIRQSLKAHEEQYQVGAWEKFNNKQQTKKRPIFWIGALSGVAAILAICFSLILTTNKEPKKVEENFVKANSSKAIEADKNVNSELIKIGSEEQKSSHQTAKIDAESEAVFINSKEKNNSSEIQTAINNNNLLIAKNANNGSNSNATNSNINNQSVQNNAVVKADHQQAVAAISEKVKPDILDFLTNETKKGEAANSKMAKNNKTSKWNLGIMLAPSFNNTNELNMGYGVTMGYQISDKLSLTSGIAYSNMTASKSLQTNIGMSSIIVGNTRSLESISQKVTGLDIPLELKYNINKNIYANFGVSALAVLNQKRNNTFVQEVVVNGVTNTISSSSNASGAAGSGAANAPAISDATAAKGQFANSYVVNQRTTESASTSQNDENFIAFYNLSFGYKRKLYKNHSVSIEPFVKLPVKQVTQDNLKLIGTGLRLKVDF